MEKHVEYELEAFKQIFESFDEDGNLKRIRMFQWMFLRGTITGYESEMISIVCLKST